MAATAVIINEFGEIGLDHLLVEKATDDVVMLQSGCLCCTIAAKLPKRWSSVCLTRQGPHPAFCPAVIETIGLADPAPIIHALISDRIVASATCSTAW